LKKTKQNDAVLTALYTIFFSWSHKGRERRFFFPSFATPVSLSPSHLPKKLRHNPHRSWPTTMMKGAEEISLVGGFGAAAQSPPQPPYPFAMTG
jgi:hypothetical protein